MELVQLKYFRTVARTGKIAAAAQELFLSAPALSTSVSRLEKELGMPLFERTGNSITLNAQGEIFLRHVERVFETLDEARIELRRSHQLDQQQIRLMTTGSSLWLDMVTRFSQEYPHVTLTNTNLDRKAIIDTLSQYTFLLAEDGEIPAAIRDTLESELLFEDNPAVLLHPSHPLAREECVTFSMLEGQTLYLPIRDTPRGERLIRMLQANGVDPDNATSCPYIISRGMLLQGSGISFSTTGASWAAQLDGLCCVPLENRAEPWKMCLFWHKDRPMTECENLFKQFVERFYNVGEHKAEVMLQ